MNKQFNRNLRLGFGISLLVLIVVGIVSYQTMESLFDSDKAVAHSNLIIQKLEKALSHMKDAETGQRGYLLTGRHQFLEPYNNAQQRALALVNEVQTLTADNPQQQYNIRNIRQIMRQRMTILVNQINRKNKGQYIDEADFDAGKAAMDALREAVDRSEANELQLLDRRVQKLDYYRKLTPLCIIAALTLAVAFSGLSYIKITRDINEKDKLYDELRAKEQETAAFNEELTAANEEILSTNEELLQAREELANANVVLEQRVAERTQELAESEEETQALNEELSATNEELIESQNQLKQLIDELKINEERSAKLAAIVESSDDAIIGKTTEGVITSWNAGAKKIFGYHEEEMIGEPVLKLIPEDLHHEEPVILARVKSGQHIDHYETTRRTKEGRLINVSLTISPILNKAGEIIGVSKIARDITEQKRDEQRKNDFIGMASHELKTPLTSLNALIQVLQKKLSDSNDRFVATALDKASQQTRRMTGLINGFLNISRLEAGKLDIEQRPIELNTLISENIEEASLSASNHDFIFEPGQGTIMVLADREKIGSVISNLLSNAVKYSPKGKFITIRTLVQDENVLVSVHDEGIGISQQDIEKLFERYYRVQTEHTKNISGFGVGLYLSAEIVGRHGGRIWAESEKEAGSTFYFTLPLA